MNTNNEFKILFPFCEKDIQKNELCTECQKKIDSGTHNKWDLIASAKLLELKKKGFLPGFELKKSYNLDEFVVFIVKGNIAKLIGKKGRNLIKISRAFNKKIRLIEATNNNRKLLSDLFGKGTVERINKVFKSNENEIKIILNLKEEELITKKQDLEEMLSHLLKEKTVIKTRN